MDIYTDNKISKAGQVNKADLKQVLHNMVVFLAPLGIVYLLQVNATLQNGALGLNDFIPTQATIGAIQLYIVNAVMDLVRKFTDAKK